MLTDQFSQLSTPVCLTTTKSRVIEAISPTINTSVQLKYKIIKITNIYQSINIDIVYPPAIDRRQQFIPLHPVHFRKDQAVVCYTGQKITY